jgi:UDP-N-acetylglucosamine 1-carboxyvinyltransferase
MQAQFMAMLCISEGSCIINETIFDGRDKHVHQLIRMGADIKQPHGTPTVVVYGVDTLTGSTVEAMDLRGGAALILAGLAAQGETVVQNSAHVERGYHKIEQALSGLGAAIEYKE